MCTRRSFVLLAAALLLWSGTGLAFAAGEQEAAAGDGPVTLTYMTRMRAEEFGRESFNNLAATFMENNPNVTIEFIDITYQRMREQALIMAQAGTAPDITEPVVSWVPQLAGAGILEPVSNYLSAAEIARYVASPVADASYEGVAYGVPFWHGPILPYANTTLQEQAGLAPGAVEDIHAYRDQIAKIGSLGTDSEGRNIIGFSLRNVKSANAAFWFTPWLWAWGGELVDADNNATLDTDEFRQAMEFYAWMTNSGYSAKGMDPYNTRIVFGERRAGFVFDGPWLRGMLRTLTEDPTIDDAYEVIPMPKGVTGDNWTIANPTVLVVFEGSKNKQTAFEFAKFASANTNILSGLYSNMGLLPTVNDMLDNDPLLQDEFARTFAEQMPMSRGAPWKDSRWPGLQDILAKAITEAIESENYASISAQAQREFEELLAD